MALNTDTIPCAIPIQSGAEVWSNARLSGPADQRMEFPHLRRFNGSWYCSFRHGVIHANDLSGKGLVLRSDDGVNWRVAVQLSHPGADVRDPRLSITADGKLMINGALALLESGDAEGRLIKRQSATWLSGDGENWEGPFTCETGDDTWRWSVAWHEGYGYSVGYAGKDALGTLYRTADGKTWEPIVHEFFPGRRGNEAALTFTPDGHGYCLLRAGGGGRAALGVSTLPFKGWSWRELDAVWDASGTRCPLYEVTDADLGGPDIITTEAGNILGVARVSGCNGHPSGSTLFRIDPESATLIRMATIDGGNSYPGLVEFDDHLWMSCVDMDDDRPADWKIRLLQLPIDSGATVAVPPAIAEGESLSTSDEAELARLARESKNRHLRLAATQHLNNSDVLGTIAINDPSWEVRMAAYERCEVPLRWSDWYIKPDPQNVGVREKWFLSKAVGDKDWRVVPYPAMWKQTFLGNYLGVAWYGVEFDLPDDYNGQSLQLLFGGVDSDVSIYVNGSYVGERTAESSGLPAEKLWQESFKVTISADLLFADRPNVLHIKVKSGPKNGGIHQLVVASLD